MEDRHDRVIVHIDLDCFYAQVEMNKKPELRDKPMGVQQKNIVVTCNYPARARGVGKCMYITEAREICPELVLVNGEDLAEYRRVSTAVYSSLCETGSPVERLGMDENWLDITKIIQVRRREQNLTDISLSGKVCGELECEECECVDNLKIGSVIAQELRMMLKDKHNLSSSAGIAHNKVLSKLVGGVNKPDDQTVIAPGSALLLLKHDLRVTSIPGVGRKTGELLSAAGIENLEQLRAAPVEDVEAVGIQRVQADVIKGLSWGRDNSEVKMSGRPASLGLEDRFLGIYKKEECAEKLRWLLGRLLLLLAEDGRKPTTIKITVRDYFKDKIVKKFHKESRQTKVSPRLFQFENGSIKPDSETSLVDQCLVLLGKMIDYSDSFHITLLGIAVTDFLDQVEKKGSIKNFFISPKKDGIPQSVPTELSKPKKNLFYDDSEERAQKRKQSSEEDSSKKSKVEIMVKDTNANLLVNPGPGELKPVPSTSAPIACSTCPPEYDPEVWKNLPEDLKQELIRSTCNTDKVLSEKGSEISPESKSKPNCSKLSPESKSKLNTSKLSPESRSEPNSSKLSPESRSEPKPEILTCPKGFDPEVFAELPEDIRKELLSDSAASASAVKPKRTTPPTKSSKNAKKGSATKSKEKNSILKYFNRS